MNWEKKRIREFADVYDGPHATPKESTTGAVFLGIKNIKPEGGIDLSEIRHISDSELEKWTKRVTPTKDDIVLSYEATLHRYAIIPDNFIGCLGRRMALVRVNKDEVNHKFLYYTFLSDAWRGFIDANKLTGATVDRISIKDFPDYPINLPPLITQHRIAFILSAYDDLIENNLKRIKLLEEKAFLSYKGIVNSEKLERLKLKEVAGVNESSLKASSNLDKLLYVDISSVSTGSIDNKTEYDLKEAPGRARRILKHEDIIWSCVRPNRKSYSFVFLPEDNLIASTGFAVITAKEIPSSFLYQLTTSNEFVDYLENHAKGATYPAVTSKDFEEAYINIPSESTMKEYHQNTYPLFELKHNLEKQNAKLREARDILLPRLMSGEIEV